MKYKKNKKRKISKIFKRYINGTRGAVSIFMALVMSPLLTVSLTLVESARYQDAIERIQEVTDISSFSTLADYDSYLDERFGLLAVSQEAKINNSFENYINLNVKALGNSVDINSQSAVGKYALSNTDVLKQQLLEYGEISVAAEIVTEGIDLDELLDDLEEALGLDEITKEIEAVNAGVDVAKEVETLIEALTEAKDNYSNYSTALSEYKSSYSDFKEKAEKLITELSDAEAELKEDEEPESIYDNGDVKKAINNLKKARDDYKEKAETIKTELSDMKGYIDSILNALDKLPSKLDSLKEETEESSLANECTTSTYEWLLIVFNQVSTTMKTLVGSDFDDKVNQELEKLTTQISKLNKLADKTITSSWNTDKIRTEYGTVNLKTIKSNFTSTITNLISDLDSESGVSDKESTKMGNLLDVAGDLMGVTGLYDSSLNSVVASSKLYTSTNISLSSQLSVSSMTDLLSACDNFVEGLKKFNVIKVAKALVKLLTATAKFLTAVVSWVTESLVNLARYIASGPTEWYNGLLLYGYGAYNMPNRTTCRSESTLSDYSFKKVFELGGGSYDKNITGSLKALKNISNQSGNDSMFKGAQTEYLIVGSNSEIYNQSCTFFDLYLLRLALDIIPVFKNPEVSTIAAAAGPGAWVVKLAIALAEPMLDTLVLVNEGKSYILKDTVYLSYSGIPILLNDLNEMTGFSKNVKNKIKDTIKAKNGTPKENGKFDASYTEHMLLLLLLSVSPETYLKRMQNLIQLETAEKHKNDYVFKLNKSYTYIYSEVNYTLNPMFKLDGLTRNGLFSATSKNYLGY